MCSGISLFNVYLVWIYATPVLFWVLCECYISTAVLFWVLCECYISSQPFTFNIFVFESRVCLLETSYNWIICFRKSILPIYFLIRVFSLFTFNIITNKVLVLIYALWLPFFYLFSVCIMSFFFSLFFYYFLLLCSIGIFQYTILIAMFFGVFLLYMFKVIFLVVVLEIKINILIYNNLVHITIT